MNETTARIYAYTLRMMSGITLATGLQCLMLEPMNIGWILLFFGIAGLSWQGANFAENE